MDLAKDNGFNSLTARLRNLHAILSDETKAILLAMKEDVDMLAELESHVYHMDQDTVASSIAFYRNRLDAYKCQLHELYVDACQLTSMTIRHAMNGGK